MNETRAISPRENPNCAVRSFGHAANSRPEICGAEETVARRYEFAGRITTVSSFTDGALAGRGGLFGGLLVRPLQLQPFQDLHPFSTCGLSAGSAACERQRDEQASTGKTRKDEIISESSIKLPKIRS